jgi:hypothetical protein
VSQPSPSSSDHTSKRSRSYPAGVSNSIWISARRWRTRLSAGWEDEVVGGVAVVEVEATVVELVGDVEVVVGVVDAVVVDVVVVSAATGSPESSVGEVRGNTYDGHSQGCGEYPCSLLSSCHSEPAQRSYQADQAEEESP